MALSVREKTQENERLLLSPYACLSENTKGRKIYEEECELRTCFQRDRDRIIHCKAFRRLKHKTQVFLSPEGDHYRTRLTHTLEVAQISGTIARALRLNEDLTEAIALGHDLGHTPFGHAGERALNSVMPGGFHHYEQSLRVVDKIEKNGIGLNLTEEVRDGIERHTGGREAKTLEGRVVRLADKIAYINHDIDDAVRAGIISELDLPTYVHEFFGGSASERIDSMVKSVVYNSSDDIRMDDKSYERFLDLHKFMFRSVYTNPSCKGEEVKAVQLVQTLFSYFCEHPDLLPSEYRGILEAEGVQRAACDYIAGMSDVYAVEKFKDLFIPLQWDKL